MRLIHLTFYSSHRLELLRLRRWRQHRQKVERLVRQIPIADEDALGDSREDYSRGLTETLLATPAIIME